MFKAAATTNSEHQSLNHLHCALTPVEVFLLIIGQICLHDVIGNRGINRIKKESLLHDLRYLLFLEYIPEIHINVIYGFAFFIS